MARLRNAKPKNTSGAYERLFNNAELGELASKVQSAVISSGSELEEIIGTRVPNISNLDAFLKREIMPEGVLLARKRQIKHSNTLDLTGSEPDFMVFRHRGGTQTCHIVELKDGHVFDTKKVRAEYQAMLSFIKRNAQHIKYQLRAHFCAFNQDNRQAIRDGFKQQIKLDEAMTGREFCDLLEIDYDAIVEKRRAAAPDNVDFFLSELAKIKSIRQPLHDLICQPEYFTEGCH